MAVFSGDNGTNNILGSINDDEIFGLLGDDTLLGLEGDDVIYADSEPSEIQTLSAQIDGSYLLQSDTFVAVTLSQFTFPATPAKSMGYVILDSTDAVLSKHIFVDNVSLAERGAAIDVNVTTGTKLILFTIPASQLESFPWTPFDINNVDVIVAPANVTIVVQEIESNQSNHGDDSIFGHSGDDTLYGEGGNDNIVGAAGHDVISGGDGNDFGWGGNGDDVLHGGAGNDRLYGENDDDILYGGQGDDDLWGGIGNDTLLAGAGSDHVEGGDGDDVIRGGDGSDEIWAGKGADKIYGDQGDDFIHAGEDNDLVFGGDGDDVIYGGDSADDLRGGSGNDKIYGEQGDDILRGKNGNDYLDGGIGNDILQGNMGSNTLLGGEGNDTLAAGWLSEDNFLDGESGQDLLLGSVNTDTFIFDNEDFQGQIETLTGGVQINQHIYDASSGFDILKITGEQNVDFTGEHYQSQSNITGNVISGIESVIGDSENQTIKINLYEILAQSDDVSGNDWSGFIASLGDGNDNVQFTGVNWSYHATALPNAAISSAMINKMGLTSGQVSDLNAYVFEHNNSNMQITIWTDADDVSYLGTDIF